MTLPLEKTLRVDPPTWTPSRGPLGDVLEPAGEEKGWCRLWSSFGLIRLLFSWMRRPAGKKELSDGGCPNFGPDPNAEVTDKSLHV